MVSVYTRVPVCMHVLEIEARPPGKQPVVGLTCSLHPASEDPRGALIHQHRVILKPRLIVQYYLGGTLVALEISRLLTFLTAFHVIHPSQRGLKKENVFYYAFLKRIIFVRLHMEDGLVFLGSTLNSQERGPVGSQRVLSLLDSMTVEWAAMSHGCIVPSRLGFDSSFIAHVHITPCLIMH